MHEITWDTENTDWNDKICYDYHTQKDDNICYSDKIKTYQKYSQIEICLSSFEYPSAATTLELSCIMTTLPFSICPFSRCPIDKNYSGEEFVLFSGSLCDQFLAFKTVFTTLCAQHSISPVVFYMPVSQCTTPCQYLFLLFSTILRFFFLDS